MNGRRRLQIGVLCCTVGLVGLGGCSLAPTYERPVVALPADVWSDSTWKPAQTADDQPHGNWWETFHDPVLNQLAGQIDAANPTLAAALARYDGATAYLHQLQAATGPEIDGVANLTKNRQSDNRPLRGANQPDEYAANTVGLSASYTLDIWGQVRNQIEAGRAAAQASAADLATTRLSLTALLAEQYFALRGVDLQIRIIDDTIQAYTSALDLTSRRHDGGVASGIDVARADTQLNSIRSQAADLRAQRAVYEHAIAALLGLPAMTFHLAAADATTDIPTIPIVLPSELLLRRPDIASAERRVAAANATIGVARAAYFPNLSLGAIAGVQNTGQSDLFSRPETFWSVGPLALLTLFDSGRHDAQLDQARAAWRAASADYRSTVLAAFTQVEDNLARLHFGEMSAEQQALATRSAQTALQLAMNRYREGAVNYLEVVTAQETALNAQQRNADIQTRRLLASVDLIRALGGGWQTGTTDQPGK